MGLTIHYTLSACENWTSENVRRWLQLTAGYARHLGCGSVGLTVSALERADVTTRFHKVGRKHTSRYVEIYPNEGSVLIINVGKDCQPLALGLCKYPRQWRCRQGSSLWRWHPTGTTHGWQFSWFCKTQFAGKHGKAHFFRCHKSVISALDFCRKA